MYATFPQYIHAHVLICVNESTSSYTHIFIRLYKVFEFDGFNAKDLSASDFGPLVATVGYSKASSKGGKSIPFDDDDVSFEFSASAATLAKIADHGVEMDGKLLVPIMVGSHVPANGHAAVTATSSDADILKVGKFDGVPDDTVRDGFHSIGNFGFTGVGEGEVVVTVQVTDVFDNKVKQKFTVKVESSAFTCKHLWDKDNSLKNGVYKIKPLPGADAFEAYCDMYHGGWTLVLTIGTRDRYVRHAPRPPPFP